MKKKIVYIAHPISGNIEENLNDIVRIIRIINTNNHPKKEVEEILKFDTYEISLTQNGYALGGNVIESINYDFSNIVPVCPYYVDILALDDNKPEERARGIENDIAIIKSGVFDELWLTGKRVSFGMEQEKFLAESIGLKVVDYINKI